MTNDLIFRNVLERLSNGVMTIGVDGRILTIKAAADTILGLDAARKMRRRSICLGSGST